MIYFTNVVTLNRNEDPHDDGILCIYILVSTMCIMSIECIKALRSFLLLHKCRSERHLQNLDRSRSGQD